MSQPEGHESESHRLAGEAVSAGLEVQMIEYEGITVIGIRREPSSMEHPLEIHHPERGAAISLARRYVRTVASVRRHNYLSSIRQTAQVVGSRRRSSRPHARTRRTRRIASRSAGGGDSGPEPPPALAGLLIGGAA